MTKYVRIENADNANYKVEILVMERQYAPDGAPPLPDVLVATLRADYPTDMVREYLTSSRYFIVREA
jgi:hypothetical protein